MAHETADLRASLWADDAECRSVRTGTPCDEPGCRGVFLLCGGCSDASCVMGCVGHDDDGTPLRKR